MTVLREIEVITGRSLDIHYGDWRAGDQLYFVADTRRLESTVGWEARIAWRDGLRQLHDWLAEQDLVRVAESRRKVSA